MAAKDKIIFALDVEGIAQATEWMDLLQHRVGMVKIGKQLFTACGHEAIRCARHFHHQIFLDLKYHDIPNTVKGAAIEASNLGVKFFNVHALGGYEMMRQAAEAVHMIKGGSKLLAVTILTSSTKETLEEVGIFLPVEEMVVRLAKLAQKAGADGVIASPKEISLIRQACGPDFLIVTPGVRPSDSSLDDQKRVMTPREAILAGADYLVIGRPISGTNDPIAAVEAIAQEIEAAERERLNDLHAGQDHYLPT